MANFFSNFWKAVTKPDQDNLYSKAFYDLLGGREATYDTDATTYIKKGFMSNPDVYAAIAQMSDKARSVPFYIREVKDEASVKKLAKLDYSIKGQIDRKLMQVKAFEETEKKLPLDRPNPLQTWGDLHWLAKVFLKTTGNVFLYKPSPKEGINKGQPTQLFILPSHMMKIVVKDGANLLDSENPIDHYTLIEGKTYLDFDAEDVIHIKYGNPDFSSDGRHLYGLSPLLTLVKIFEASNAALDSNVKTMLNSGVFGFITGKDMVLNNEQAMHLKGALHKMDKADGRLSRMTAGSFPLDFTKISVDTKELEPFTYLNNNRKTICAVLNWSDKLLGNDEGSTYNNLKEEKKRLLTDNILPDCILIQEALTHGFLRHFRGYEKCVWDYDITEMPEMQEDFEKLVNWMDKAPLTPNEKRVALNYETIDSEEMDVVWIQSGLKRIDDVGITLDDIEKSYELR